MLRINPVRAGLIVSWLVCGLLQMHNGQYASAQMLARPGWAGSGIRSDPWWRNAVIYGVKETVPLTDPDEWNARLNSLRLLGVDAIILRAPEVQLDPAKLSDNSPDTAGPEWMNSFDELVHHAGAAGVRILVRVPARPGDTSTGTVRMWLSHGVAGLYLVPNPQSGVPDASTLNAVRKLVAASPGNRVVLTSLETGPTEAPHPARGISNLLHVDKIPLIRPLTAATLRATLQHALMASNRVIELDPQPPGSPQLQEILATVDLTLSHTSLISPEMISVLPQGGAASEKGPNGNLAEWIRALSALHHDNLTLRYGQPRLLDFDAENALVWVVRPAAGMGSNAPVVVVCNVGAEPLGIPVSSVVRQSHLTGTVLRPILQSGSGMTSPELKNLEVPPFGVYIGELRR